MYPGNINVFADLAVQKANRIQCNFLSFVVSSIMAGIFIGLGIILIFSVASGVEPGYQKLVMGVSFSIALMLVVFTGTELFTGHTMYMSLGLLERVVRLRDLFAVWITSWFGNLIGSVILVGIFIAGGAAEQLAEADSLLQNIAVYKVNSSATELVAKGILCNILVCLALWISARVDSDIAKCTIIFWCLFAFIASGYEHSIANMTLLTIALMAEHSHAISLGGLLHNLIWVTLGNIIGGAVFVALAFWVATGSVNSEKTSR